MVPLGPFIVTGLGAYTEGDRPKDWGYALAEGGVMLGSETLTGERPIMEGAGSEGVPMRGTAVAPGGETEWSPLRRLFWVSVVFPFEVGLSKF